MKSCWSMDGRGSLYVEWEIAPDAFKRAWIQHRSGDRDWAKTGRYLNVARIKGPGLGPSGMPADFPIFAKDKSDRKILEEFILSIALAVGACHFFTG